MSAKPNHSKLEATIGKLDAFCTAHSRLKSDEELRNSFDNFLTERNINSDCAEDRKLSNYFTIVEEIIGVLHELEEQLMAECGKIQVSEAFKVDSSNRLYASLKRHPE